MRIVARTSRVAGVGSSTPERSSSSADPTTAACSRTSSSARWKPNASARQRRCWSSPYASRSAPAAASDRWTARRSSRKASAPGYRPLASVRVAARRCAVSASIRRCGESASRRSSSPATTGRTSAASASRWSSSGVAGVSRSEAVIDLAMRRASDSRPSRTCSAAISTARRVTSAVTRGLPSRSPPTHVPHRRNGRSNAGARAPEPGASARSISRATIGNTSKIVWSNSAISARTSSSGSGRRARTWPVRHSAVTSSIRRRSTSVRSLVDSCAPSSRSTSAPIRHRVSTIARRRASVGCAVRTGTISSRPAAP